MNSTINFPTLKSTKNRTIAELAVIILSKEWPLDLKDIHSKVVAVRKNVSRQATHKSLTKLVKRNILLKEEMQYRLNPQWIEQINNFSTQTKGAYKNTVVENGVRKMNGIPAGAFFKFEFDKENYWFHPKLGLICCGPKNISELQELLKTVRNDDFIKDIDFTPRNYFDLALFVTYDCNLRCIYCYSEGGKRKEYMDWGTAKTAIDFCFEKRLNHDRFTVFFHGGGEPTLGFPLIKKVTLYIEQKCAKEKIIPNFKINTNGCFAVGIAQFLIAHNFKVAISFDGPRDVQDEQRPLRSGDGSYWFVSETTKKLIDGGLAVRARATIIQSNIKRMKEMVKHFHDLGFKNISLEPVRTTGRATNRNVAGVDLLEYANGICECMDSAEKFGMELTCFNEILFSSVLDRAQHLTTSYCGANGYHFIVTPNKKITSCFESENDLFVYGTISNNVKLDNNKLDFLRSRSPDKIAKCKECFAKYICGGGCSYASLLKGKHYADISNDYCEAYRLIIKKTLVKIFEHKRRNKREQIIQILDKQAPFMEYG